VGHSAFGYNLEGELNKYRKEDKTIRDRQNIGRKRERRKKRHKERRRKRENI
jgi:hypothetical protein